MIFQLIDETRGDFPVETLCDVLGVSKSGFYAWKSRPVSARAREDAQILAEIRQVHRESKGTYGSPRVHAVLRGHGRRIGKTRIERLMRAYAIRGAVAIKRKPRTTDSNHGLPIAPNLLERNFTASAPNTAWVADITYVHTDEGWLYLAAIMDLCTRKIVGWAMRETLHAEIVVAAWLMAIQRQRPGRGLIHHSDRGSQYACEAFRAELDKAGAVASMSRSGDCLDNAAMESFWHTLKTELVYRTQYETKEDARRDLFAFIEGFYNPHRLHSTLGYISPAEAERRTA